MHKKTEIFNTISTINIFFFVYNTLINNAKKIINKINTIYYYLLYKCIYFFKDKKYVSVNF